MDCDYKIITVRGREVVRPERPGCNQLKTLEKFGGGGWTRTDDLRIMSSIPDSDSQQNQVVSSAESGKVGQNPQLRRNLNSIPEDDGKEQV